MNPDRIWRIDLQARGKFRYVTDGIFDTWRSHANEVLADEAWFGDCDDLASTVLDLLGRNGVALADRYRLLVASRGTGVDHMVGCVVDQGGKFWIVGDTFGESYDASAIRHTVLQYNRLSEGQTWREGAPWQPAS